MTREGAPRLTMLLMLALSGGFAFLTSLLSLGAGLDSMAIRYPLAALAGYCAFIVLARVWISLRGRSLDPMDMLDVANVGDVGSDQLELEPAPVIAAGGRSGGAGASDTWGHAVQASAGEGVSGALDVDEIRYVVLAGACAFAGVVAIGIPAIVVIASLAAAGLVMQALAPEAKSIGGVIKALTG